MALPVATGIALAIGIGVLARVSRLDRDRAYYPLMLIVIAWYYMLFAVMSGSMRTLLLESIPVAAFMVMAVVGFRRNPGLVATGLVAHGLFDSVHGQVITNTGMPSWWPAFCASIDIALGVYALWQFALSRSQRTPRERFIESSRARRRGHA
jgi:hypothetical protein